MLTLLLLYTKTESHYVDSFPLHFFTLHCKEKFKKFFRGAFAPRTPRWRAKRAEKQR